jgi:hypothetical protein
MGSKRKPAKRKPSEIPPAMEKEVENATDPECEDLTERILDHLPNLASEVQSSETEVQIDGVRWEETDRTRQPVQKSEDRFSGYSPDVIDFLRRCATDEEALEIISFLEKRGEINTIHAEELRKQLQNQGLRSFGARKSWGYYERASK